MKILEKRAEYIKSPPKRSRSARVRRNDSAILYATSSTATSSDCAALFKLREYDARDTDRFDEFAVFRT
jgi:hypothetical protein